MSARRTSSSGPPLGHYCPTSKVKLPSRVMIDMGISASVEVRLRGDRWPPGSPQLWRCACLVVGAGAGWRQVRRDVVPDHVLGLAMGCGDRDLRFRGVKGCARLRRAADRAGPIMRPVPAALVALLLTRAVMADGGRRLQRIGRGDAGGPARDDRREHLQCQRK